MMGNRKARPGIPKQVINPDDFIMTVAEKERLVTRMKAYLDQYNYHQNSIADAIGKSKSYVSNLISGKCEMMVKDLVFICRLVGKDPGEILIEVLEKRDSTEKSEIRNRVSQMPDSDLKALLVNVDCLQKALLDEIEKRNK